MPSYPNDDPIQSFGTEGGPDQSEVQEKTVEVPDKGMDCECGIDVSPPHRHELFD